MTITLDAAQHLIKAVTVFSSRKAEVIRTFTLDLADGQNELAITSLPSCIDTDSARVTGLGDAVLFDVVCTVDDARDGPDINTDSLKALERRRGVLEGENALRGRAADILVQYGQTLSAEYTTVNVVNTFLDSLVQRGANTLREIETLDEQVAEVEKEIAKEKRRLQKERLKAAARGRVSAVIMAKRAGKVEITLTYMVSNATWSPSYDLRATTEDGKPSGTVALHYRASIQQNTGEDWRDTAVSVSTAKPGTWSTIPALRAMKISPASLGHLYSKQSNQSNTGALAFSQARRAAPHPPPAPAVAQMAQGSGRLIGQVAPPTGSYNTGGMTSLFGTNSTIPQQQQLQPHQQQQQQQTSLFGAANRSGTNAATFQAETSNTGGDVIDSWTAPDGWTAVDDIPESGPDADKDAEEKETAWTETKAVVTEGAVASSFRIEGKCTIPSEPTAHKVAIAILSFSAKVNYITVPRSAPIAFLQCEVKNTSEYRLLPGSVNVFLDNSPVSKTAINDVNPEEVFKCTLGPDPSLRIKCTRLPRTVASSGSAYAAQTTVTTYKICTTVHNAHTFPVKGLQVRDAAPDAGQPSTNASAPGIKVMIKRPEGLGEAAPTAAVDVPNVTSSGTCSVKVRWGSEGGEKEGKYVWIVDVGAGEEVKLEAEYEVRAPADFQWQLQEDFFH